MIAWRDATASDGPALSLMARTTWADTFGHSISACDLATYLDEAYGPDGTIHRHLADAAYRYRLAIDGERIAGFAKLAPCDLDEQVAGAGAIKLDQLYVARDWQGAGIAAALMDWTIATARARGAAALVLTVWEENERARRFYSRRGFVHVGDYAFRIGAQVDRDLVMKLTL